MLKIIAEYFSTDLVLPPSGHYAYVDRQSGTIFGRVFAQALIERASYRNINSIITTVSNIFISLCKELFTIEVLKSVYRQIET